ncbi:hypothetical protein D0X99_15045 [Algoriphagus lacus]|uniref:DUF2306 domain-containing protein n=1 Tax=Algoriphagus lacus TaxID=2056311 RepID=A0A418PPV9_9BACT|nr:hypothetical protein [Algoriphagus lacus]RIW14116.1 hypothetical protein D0X99_15045 [Algoriphagus lacus]
MSEKFFNLLLLLHIVGGSIGLLCGILVFILKKGTKTHANLGKLFIFGMLLSGVTAQVMAILHPNTFLFMVGVFTIYLVGTGARAIFTKSSRSIHSIDRFLQFGMVLAGLALIYLGIAGVMGGNNFGIVYIVFASIGLLMAVQDIRSASKHSHDKKAYVRKHLQRLGGGFIASATAFLVVNLRELPDWLPVWVLWLIPTLLISPLISFYSKKYKAASL